MATLTDPSDLQDNERVSDAHVSDADLDQIEAYANDPANATEGKASARAGNTVENASGGTVKSHPEDDTDENGVGKSTTSRGRTNAGARSESTGAKAGA